MVTYLVVREIVKYWRAKGLKIIMYLDDGGDNYENALVASNLIKKDLDYFSFSVAHEKCNWVPVQKLEWFSIGCVRRSFEGNP